MDIKTQEKGTLPVFSVVCNKQGLPWQQKMFRQKAL